MTEPRPLAGFSDAELSVLGHIAVSGRLILLTSSGVAPEQGRTFATMIFAEMRDRGLDPQQYHARLIQRALEAAGANVRDMLTLDDEQRKKANEN
jgi:hypothetical protein